MQHRQDQGAAIHDDLLATKSSSYEGDFLAGPTIKTCEDKTDRHQADQDTTRIKGNLNNALHDYKVP